GYGEYRKRPSFLVSLREDWQAQSISGQHLTSGLVRRGTPVARGSRSRAPTRLGCELNWPRRRSLLLESRPRRHQDLQDRLDRCTGHGRETPYLWHVVAAP